MAGNPARHGVPKPTEPLVHELPPFHIGNSEVLVRLAAWRDDGTWRGRLVFGATDAQTSTADIFCAATESELWESVRDLGEHHLRDLYRSLAP